MSEFEKMIKRELEINYTCYFDHTAWCGDSEETMEMCTKMNHRESAIEWIDKNGQFHKGQSAPPR